MFDEFDWKEAKSLHHAQSRELHKTRQESYV